MSFERDEEFLSIRSCTRTCGHIQRNVVMTVLISQGQIEVIRDDEVPEAAEQQHLCIIGVSFAQRRKTCRHIDFKAQVLL